MTLDTDILVLSEDLDEAEALLRKAGCEYVGNRSIGGSTWRLPKGRSLDLLALDHAWVGEALDAAVNDAKGHSYASLPFLILMKLESGRLQDLADISRMLGCAGQDQVDAVRAVVERFRPQDMPDLQSMLRVGRLEHDG